MAASKPSTEPDPAIPAAQSASGPSPDAKPTDPKAPPITDYASL